MLVLLFLVGFLMVCVGGARILYARFSSSHPSTCNDQMSP